MARPGISTVIGIIVLTAFVAVAAATVATFFQSALEDVQEGPDVGFENALEVVHVSCIGHEFRLTLRNTGDEQFDASSARIYLYDGSGNLLQVTDEQDFSGKRFEQPDGVDTMTVTVPDAKPLTDEMPFDVAFNEEGVKGVCSPEYDADLVAAWSFDATDRNTTHVFDLIGTDNGALFGGPTLGVEGVRDDGSHFDGSDDHVRSPLNTTRIGNFTVSVWARFDDLSGSPSNLGSAPIRSANEDFEWAIYGGNGDIRGYLHVASTGHILSWSGAEEGQWHHISFRRQDDTLGLYVDGTLQDSKTDADIENQVDATAVEIARPGSDSAVWFNGTVDDARVYNRSLSAEEIQMDAVVLTS